MKTAMGYSQPAMKRPAALGKAAKAAKPAALEKAAKAAKPAALKKAVKRKKKGKKKQGSSGTRKVWEKVYMTTGQNPPRSYLTGKYPGEKKHLIVEVSAARCPQYQEVILEIKAALEKDALTKEEAKNMKEELRKECGY